MVVLMETPLAPSSPILTTRSNSYLFCFARQKFFGGVEFQRKNGGGVGVCGSSCALFRVRVVERQSHAWNPSWPQRKYELILQLD